MPEAVFAPSLNILLGPPIDGWQRDLFSLYQRGWEEKDESKLEGWEKHERDAIEFLFHWEHDAPSTMEELFTRLQGIPVRISGYEWLTGFHRGFWIIGFSLPCSRMLTARLDRPWPPEKKICDDAGNALGYILKREWVRWYAVTRKRLAGVG